MAQHYENNPIHDAVELLKTNGFDGLAEAVTVLLNSAMVAERSEYLGATTEARLQHRHCLRAPTLGETCSECGGAVKIIA